MVAGEEKGVFTLETSLGAISFRMSFSVRHQSMKFWPSLERLMLARGPLRSRPSVSGRHKLTFA